MLNIVWRTLALLAILTFTHTSGQSQKLAKISEEEMQSLLAEYNSRASEYCYRSMDALWNVTTDVRNQTKVNKRVMYLKISR